MPLVFEQVIDLTTYADNVAPAYVGSLKIANESDNNINQYYINANRTRDKNADIILSNYDALVWDGPNTSLTNLPVKRIGVKSFPQQGAVAFFSLLYEERSKILAPVFIKKTRYQRPTFTLVQGEGTITCTMTSPADITYICWRVVMRCGEMAFEYVSYEDTLTVDTPYLSGTYDCYCVGYTGEGQAVSDDSDHITIVIQGTGEDPIDKFKYYTQDEMDEILTHYYDKTAIDAMFGDVATLVDNINGEVI